MEENTQNNRQARKWMITINNPSEKGITHELIIDILRRLGVPYFCMADEIGEKGTYHTHVYFWKRSPIRFSTVKSKFPVAHIEQAYGTSKENRDYIRKEGKWAETNKAETSVPGTFYEEGNMPTRQEEGNPQKSKILQLVKEGYSDTEIIKEEPSTMYHLDDIGRIRQTLLSENYSKENREVKVWYIYGETGTGKTRTVMEKFGSANVCRITKYKRAGGVLFDSYKSQDVLVFEEYDSQIPIEEMLVYLDRYPVELPARYFDRVACYHYVFILSNIPLSEQYPDVQSDTPEKYKALQRRIHNIAHLVKKDEQSLFKTEKGVWIDGNTYNNYTVLETGNPEATE